MRRKRSRLLRKLPWWAKLGAIVAAPLVALNLSVAFFGSSYVFPLSPWFLKEKAHALGTYLTHRPFCLLRGHGDLAELVASAEKRHGLPAGLLAALIEVESESRVHRISAAGAMGPGQLMPETAKMLRVKDPFEPSAAIDASARYLAQHLRRFERVELAVAAYNAGPGAVGKTVPKNGETEFYVAKVLRAYASRRPALRQDDAPGRRTTAARQR